MTIYNVNRHSIKEVRFEIDFGAEFIQFAFLHYDKRN